MDLRRIRPLLENNTSAAEVCAEQRKLCSCLHAPSRDVGERMREKMLGKHRDGQTKSTASANRTRVGAGLAKQYLQVDMMMQVHQQKLYVLQVAL